MIKINIWTHFLNSDYWSYANLFFLYVGFACLIHANEWDDFATFSVAFLALIFSFLAHKHTKEKFRLDLLERRSDIYKNVLTFCSYTGSAGRLFYNEKDSEEFKRVITAAHESFRDIGLHKARTLFGQDINDLLNIINNHYVWLTLYNRPPEDTEERKKWAQEKNNKISELLDMLGTLPNLFRPYIYFGDYKK